MMLHPSLTTPLWALYSHIAAGNLALLFGAVALFARKGERVHRMAGTGFVAAMLTMATLAVYMGLVIPKPSNVAGGLFALYLVATAWMTVRQPEATLGAFEKIAPLALLAIILAELRFGWIASHSPTGHFDRFRPIFYWVFAGVCTIPALLDLNMILHGGVSGRQRIARHAWRMCMAFFAASASFFLVVLMIFWLARVALTRRFKSEPIAA